MPIRNGLSAGDRGILLSPQKAGSNFGQHSDYAYVYVYDDTAEEDTLLSINVVTASAFPPAQTAGKVLIDIGQNLRDFGYEEGEFRVSYYFYRPLAGDPESNQYFLSKISKDRTEIEIRLNPNIEDFTYISDLNSVNGEKLYVHKPHTNAGYEFHKSTVQSEANVVTLKLEDGDPGFNTSMKGGRLVISDVYKVKEAVVPEGYDPLLGSGDEFDEFFDKTKKVETKQDMGPGAVGQPDDPYTDQDGSVYEWTHISTNNNTDVETWGWVLLSGPTATQTKDEWATRIVNKDYVGTILKVHSKDQISVSLDWESRRTQLETMGEQHVIKGVTYPTTVSSFKPQVRYPNGYILYSENKVNDLNTYLIVQGEAYLITNEFKDPTGFISIKLYTPLSDTIEEAAKGYFVAEVLEPVEESIKIIPFIEDVELNKSTFLRLPNMGSEDSQIEFRGTNFNSFDTLVGSNTTVIQELEDKLVSGSLLDVKVNIDFQKRITGLEEYNDNGFSSFVNFSSAEERLKNFKYKLGLIEEYTISQSLYTVVSSSSDKQSFYGTKVDQVKNSFDHYEDFLYNESSSYVSSSAGQFHDTSWPKENSSSPYTLVPSTGSIAVTWYNTMIESASLYDIQNDSRLVNNLPGHVKYDDESKTFLEFMDMIGQQFDETWVYLKHFTDMNDRQSKLSKGISKDIVKHVARASGLEVVNGNDLLNLSEYLLGKDIDDASQKFEKAQEEVTEEIWKRILANLPYFQRTKGTTRALKGLLNCYGIPSSILRVREYGGPDYDNRITYDLQRKFTYALDFKSSQYVEHLWTTDNSSGRYPETVEFRFRTPKRQNQTIVQKGNDWAISLLDGGTTNKGKLKFQLTGSSDKFFITSSTQQFYNDEMWSVMLTRRSASGVDLSNDNVSQNITYELTTKQYDATRFKINYQTSSSFSTSSVDLNGAFTSSAAVYIGGSGSAFDGNNLSGSLMEYRLWTEPLSESKFDNHVKTPKAYNGNTTSSHADNLVYRLTFDENVDLSGSAGVNFVSNSVDNTTYSARTGSQNSFTDNFYRSISEIEEMKIPDIGASRRSSNKIRIESSYLTGSLSPQTTLQKSSFDFAPADSNKLGVYFSPTDVVDKDIIYSLADINYDDYIGDPRDQFEHDYRGLKEIQNAYWKKYSKSNNFWDYLRILKYYDSGIFKQIKTLLPARVKSTLGVLVEPNILNRSKEVLGNVPNFESLYYENAGEFDPGIRVGTGTAPFVSTSSAESIVTVGGDFPYYEGESNISYWIPESGSIGVLAMPSRYRLHGNSVSQSNEWGLSYLTASITKGDVNFEEVLNPTITGSTLSEHNFEYRYFFHSDASASRHPTVGIRPVHIGAMSGSITVTSLTAPHVFVSNGLFMGHYSHSLVPSEFQSMAYDSTLFRAFYKGTNHGSDPQDPNYPAVEMTITNPTRLVSKEPGESRLVDDSKLNPRDTGFQEKSGE
jgi:hypothetical protein